MKSKIKYFIFLFLIDLMGFLDSSLGKESACEA